VQSLSFRQSRMPLMGMFLLLIVLKWMNDEYSIVLAAVFRGVLLEHDRYFRLFRLIFIVEIVE
jgi:hypothetical protein